jgi:hypothetical protein
MLVAIQKFVRQVGRASGDQVRYSTVMFLRMKWARRADSTIGLAEYILSTSPYYPFFFFFFPLCYSPRDASLSCPLMALVDSWITNSPLYIVLSQKFA